MTGTWTVARILCVRNHHKSEYLGSPWFLMISLLFPASFCKQTQLLQSLGHSCFWGSNFLSLVIQNVKYIQPISTNIIISFLGISLKIYLHGQIQARTFTLTSKGAFTLITLKWEALMRIPPVGSAVDRSVEIVWCCFSVYTSGGPAAPPSRMQRLLMEWFFCGTHMDSWVRQRVQPPILAIAHIAKFGDQM